MDNLFASTMSLWTRLGICLFMPSSPPLIRTIACTLPAIQGIWMHIVFSNLLATTVLAPSVGIIRPMEV